MAILQAVSRAELTIYIYKKKIRAVNSKYNHTNKLLFLCKYVVVFTVELAVISERKLITKRIMHMQISVGREDISKMMAISWS